MSFTTDLLTGIAVLLGDANIGLTWNDTGAYALDQTGIIIMAVPPSPDRIVTLTAYDLTDDPTLSDSEKGLQVRSRSGSPDPRDVLGVDDAIANLLLGNYPLDLSTGVRITTLLRSSSTPLGQDDNKRWSYVSTYTLGLHRPGSHRI